MMKKTVTILFIFVLFVVSAATLIWTINDAQANPIVPTEIHIYSPRQKVYNTNQIELTFIAPSEQAFENITFTSFSYSLDGQAKVSVSQNITLTGLLWGSHYIIVYGIDSQGYTRYSNRVQFDVYYSTAWLAFIAVIIAIVASVCFSIFVFWRRIKREDAFIKSP